MPGVKVSGAEFPIKNILSDRFVFEIPSYQRPYSWTPGEAGVLMEDRLDALEASGVTDPDPYSLGFIVLAKEEGSPNAKVADGQQRLTTVAISARGHRELSLAGSS